MTTYTKQRDDGRYDYGLVVQPGSKPPTAHYLKRIGTRDTFEEAKLAESVLMDVFLEALAAAFKAEA